MRHPLRQPRASTTLAWASLLVVLLAGSGCVDSALGAKIDLAGACHGHGQRACKTPTPLAPTATASPTSAATKTATASATVTATRTPTATPSPTVIPGPTGTPAPAPSGWTTVLDDEFTASGIPSHWELYDGPYGSGPSNNCAAPSQDSAPGDGYLYLTMGYKPSGACGAGWYEGGMQITDAYDLPQQAVTVRWRILPSANPSVVFSHHIVPMIFPDDPKYQWYQGEMDLCETESYTDCWTFIHDGTAGDEGRQNYHDYAMDLTQWHTWRFEQAHNTLTVYLDDMPTPIWRFAGDATTLPDAMRRAVLQQECPANACPPASYAGETERIQIDWITIQAPA
jgi:hypothetical protein